MTRYRRVILWSFTSAVVVMAVLLSMQVRTIRRERALAEALRRYMQMDVLDREKVEVARSEGRIGTKDLPTLLKWFRLSGGSRLMRYVNLRLYGWAFPEVSKSAISDVSFLGLFGFKVLGTNAAPAIPELVRLCRAKHFNHAFPIDPLAAIGEPAWAIAPEFAASEDEAERRLAAYLIGVLRVRPTESVDVLLKLINDSSSQVRTMALKALGEFTDEKGEKVFIPMLRDPDDEDRFRISAYGLRNGSTNALIELVRAYDGTTNTRAQAAVMVALIDRGFGRDETLQDRTLFYANAEMRIHNYFRFPMFTDSEEARIWSAVRSNVIAGREPDFYAVYTEETKRAAGVQREGEEIGPVPVKNAP